MILDKEYLGIGLLDILYNGYPGCFRKNLTNAEALRATHPELRHKSLKEILHEFTAEERANP